MASTDASVEQARLPKPDDRPTLAPAIREDPFNASPTTMQVDAIEEPNLAKNSPPYPARKCCGTGRDARL
jgi:hypothetical protein